MQNFITMVMNSLKSMSFTAIIDILVVAFIFYKGYMLIKETRAEQLLKGIAFIIILIPISAILNLSPLFLIIFYLNCLKFLPCAQIYKLYKNFLFYPLSFVLFTLHFLTFILLLTYSFKPKTTAHCISLLFFSYLSIQSPKHKRTATALKSPAVAVLFILQSKIKGILSLTEHGCRPSC